MQRLLCLSLLLVSASALADTTLDITVPGGQTCTYTTGAVSTGSTPGHLQATATSQTGAGCGSSGSGAVTFGPASPLAPAIYTLPNTSGAANFTFQALNATQCTGSLTGGNGNSTASFSGGATLCTGTACNNQILPVVNFANNSTTTDAVYTVTVTCTGAGPQASTTSTVTVPHTVQPPPTCRTIAGTGTVTQFTQMSGQHTVHYYGQGANTGDIMVDVGSFSSVWFGAWPGDKNRQARFSLPTNQYLAMKFTVPSTFFAGYSTAVYGNYAVGETDVSGKMSMTISTTCGDFSDPATNPGSTVISGCYKNGMVADSFLQWRSNNRCILSDSQTYYLNIINADTTNVTPTAGTASTTAVAGSNCSSVCTDPVNITGNW